MNPLAPTMSQTATTAGAPNPQTACPSGVVGSITLAPYGDPDKADAQLTVAAGARNSRAAIDFTSYRSDGTEYDFSRGTVQEFARRGALVLRIDVPSAPGVLELKCASTLLDRAVNNR